MGEEPRIESCQPPLKTPNANQINIVLLSYPKRGSISSFFCKNLAAAGLLQTPAAEGEPSGQPRSPKVERRKSKEIRNPKAEEAVNRALAPQGCPKPGKRSLTAKNAKIAEKRPGS
jgi:hypothetical protein